MKTIRKKEGMIVQAYCLGEDNPEIDKLLKAGYIKKEDENHWRVFSREVKGGLGEQALSGDFVKVDSLGAPYPNSREFFLSNHKHIEGNTYKQIPQILKAWSIEERMCPEIQFLIDHKGLIINEESQESYFNAPLWGDLLSAARDAVIVFYELKYDADYTVMDAEFNFVERDEFIKTYDVIHC